MDLLLSIQPNVMRPLLLFSPDGTKLLVNNELWDVSDLARPRLAIRRSDKGSAELFRSPGKLESAARPNGPWTPVEEAGNPHHIEANESMNVFRVRRD